MNEKKSLHCPNCGASVSHDCARCPYCRSTLSVTACPKCFAAVFTGMAHCPDCGAAIDRSEVAEKNNLLCPKCAIPLKQILVGDVSLCECATCGGLWLDTDTFKALTEETADQEQILAYDSPIISAVNSEAGQSKWKYMPCPECGELMLRKNFLGCSGVIVDFCKNHGTWFEYKELQRIVQFIQSGGMLKARQLEMDKLKEEQQKLKDMTLNKNMTGVLMMNSLSEQDETFQTRTRPDKLLSFFESLAKLLR